MNVCGGVSTCPAAYSSHKAGACLGQRNIGDFNQILEMSPEEQIYLTYRGNRGQFDFYLFCNKLGLMANATSKATHVNSGWQ